jgi:hypothetical protein
MKQAIGIAIKHRRKWHQLSKEAAKAGDGQRACECGQAWLALDQLIMELRVKTKVSP